MAFKTYSPRDVVVTWNGVTLMGFASDTFITMQRYQDVVTEYWSADGPLTLTKSAILGGSIEIALAANSPSNKLLAVAAFAQEKAGADVPISNFTVFDPSGSVIAVAVNAYLKTLPSVELAKDSGEKTWVWGCETLLYSDDLDGALSSIGDFVTKGVGVVGL